MTNISAGCIDSSDSSLATTIDFTASPAVRKERGKKLITTNPVLLRFAQDVDYFKMPSSNFKFINSVVRLVEDPSRVWIYVLLKHADNEFRGLQRK